MLVIMSIRVYETLHEGVRLKSGKMNSTGSEGRRREDEKNLKKRKERRRKRKEKRNYKDKKKIRTSFWQFQDVYIGIFIPKLLERIT